MRNESRQSSSREGEVSTSPREIQPTGMDGSEQNRAEAPSASPCALDGAILLRTEQVLLRIAPHLMEVTSRIRRDGWLRTGDSEPRFGFKSYTVSVPASAVQEIIGKLRQALVHYPSEAWRLRELILAWKEVHRRCSE